MNAEKLLKQKGINPNKLVLQISAEEALENLIEAIEDYDDINLKIDKMSKKDLEILLDSYGDAVINYHHENDHQERGAFLSCGDMLKKYGLTDEGLGMLDFA